MIKIKPVKNYLEEFVQSTEVTTITRYLEGYLEGIEENISELENSASFLEARIQRSSSLFNKDIELSPERKKLIANILGTIKKFPITHSFYKTSKRIPPCLVPYFQQCVFNCFKNLTVGQVLKRIEISNGAYGLFNIIYEDTLAYNWGIVNNAISIKIMYEEKEYILGKEGIPVTEYYKENTEKVQSQWTDINKFSSQLNHWLKTNIAEEIGISYFMRAFRIPADQIKKAVIPLPLGTTFFPDFILDTIKFTEPVNEFLFSTVGFSRTQYILVDVKASINTTSPSSFDGIRLRYTSAKNINDRAKLLKIGNNQEIINLLPPDEYTPTVLTSTQFIEFIKFFINDLYDQDKEYSKGKSGSKSFDDVQKFLKSDSINIIYEEVGANVGTQPSFYAVDVIKDSTYTLIKQNNNVYKFIREGVTIASLVFYKGELAKKLPFSIQKQINPEKIKSIKPPEEIIDDNNEEGLQEETNTNVDNNYLYQNSSDAIRDIFPVEDWIFMFKWNSGGLRKIEIPAFVPTYQGDQK